jgi:small-conductance mechanosensitive channel
MRAGFGSRASALLPWGMLVFAALQANEAFARDTAMPEWVDRIGEGAAALVGPWVLQEVFLGVRWMTLTASALVLVLVALADAILRWVIRRKIRDDQARAATTPEREREFRHWIDRGLDAAIPPLALLLWVHGLFAALSIVLLDLRFRDAAETGLHALTLLRSVGALGAMFWLLYRLSGVLESRLTTASMRTGSTWDRFLYPLAGRTVRLTLPLVVLILGVPTLPVSPEMHVLFRNALSLLLIGAVAYVLFQLVQVAEELLLAQYRIDVKDNLRARKIYTQVTVLKKVAIVVIGVFTLASMLMVFDSVRQFGTSILASAGIAGIIIGFAAQRSIATLLAGFQIAVTQPIRLDDVVIVENEWGRIEDITLTHVVVCIWDLRRLILPITYFIERPFQNWTRTSADILGTVFLHVDYTMPLEPLREELDRVLQRSRHWDGKVKGIVVTDAKEHTLEVRVLASAVDAGAAWDLRCELREKLIEFIQKNHPESLPRMRAALEPAVLGAARTRESAEMPAAAAYPSRSR